MSDWSGWIGWSRQGGQGGPCGPVVQVVQVVKVVSHDDMHSEIYGLHGLNHQIIETSLDVTSVTSGLTCEGRALFCFGRIREEFMSAENVCFNITPLLKVS